MKKRIIAGTFLIIALVIVSLSGCKKDDKTSDNAIKDGDGNIYTSVTIGTQVWLAENLKTTKYRNGDPIQNVTDTTAWKNLTSGAYCAYNNSLDTAAIYGYLYNWYAVNDNRGIAPRGWHVATDDEWKTLTDFLGGLDVAGGKLKASGTNHWCSCGTEGTNESGFNALPGGMIYTFFERINTGGLWWTSTDVEELGPYYWTISAYLNSIERSYTFKDFGLSVRCVKD